MLVLSRKKNERVVINHDIVITVVEIRGDKVRLGIEAPQDVQVHRQEVYDAIRRDGKQTTHAERTGVNADHYKKEQERLRVERVLEKKKREDQDKSL